MHDGARDGVGPGGHRALGDVAEREVGEDDVTRVGWRVIQATTVDDDVARELHVGIGEHRALGRTGRPRGVDQRDDVTGLRLIRDPVEGSGIGFAMGVAPGEELLPAHELGMVDGRDAAGLEVDDALESGALRLDEEGLVDLLLVLGDEDARP